MAPNLKSNFNLPQEHELLVRPEAANNEGSNDELTELLDKQADTNGLKSMNADAEDWTDVKHSERKKRDRILDGKARIVWSVHSFLCYGVHSVPTINCRATDQPFLQLIFTYAQMES